MKQLSSGALTGERCACGEPVSSYHVAGPYAPGDDMPPLDALPWRWVFVCEAGHYQEATQPATVPVKPSRKAVAPGKG